MMAVLSMDEMIATLEREVRADPSNDHAIEQLLRNRRRTGTETSLDEFHNFFKYLKLDTFRCYFPHPFFIPVEDRPRERSSPSATTVLKRAPAFRLRPVNTFVPLIKRGPHFSSLITLGRQYRNDIVLDNPLVSNFHAYIRRDGERCILVDGHSRNGSYMNGQQLVPNLGYILNDGEVLSFSLQASFIFHTSVTRTPL